MLSVTNSVCSWAITALCTDSYVCPALPARFSNDKCPFALHRTNVQPGRAGTPRGRCAASFNVDATAVVSGPRPVSLPRSTHTGMVAYPAQEREATHATPSLRKRKLFTNCHPIRALLLEPCYLKPQRTYTVFIGLKRLLVLVWYQYCLYLSNRMKLINNIEFFESDL
jgi:hypothetical protein